MNANFVEENQIVDRYLLGQLSEQEAEEFEILCLHDQSMQEELELSDKMLSGYKRADELNMLQTDRALAAIGLNSGHRGTELAETPALASRISPTRYAAAASVFMAVCVLSMAAIFSQRPSSTAFEPQINTPIYDLARTRSAAAEPDYIVRFSEEPEWLVLSMDLGEDSSMYLDQVDYDNYRATLIDQDESVVWQGDGLEKNSKGALTISLNSAKLGEGNYTLRIDKLVADQSPQRVAEYGFKALLRK